MLRGERVTPSNIIKSRTLHKHKIGQLTVLAGWSCKIVSTSIWAISCILSTLYVIFAVTLVYEHTLSKSFTTVCKYSTFFNGGFKLLIYFSLIVTEAILLMKSKSVSETDQYCAMRFKFLALRNNKVLTHFLLETTSTLQYSLSKL